MKVGSLFSGIGGFDLGLERAGMRVVWQVENNPFCRSVLRSRWPSVPCFDDIRAIDWHLFHALPDLICGGFPCQPFSVAGKRRGKNDDRYLWPEVVRCLDALRPAWFVGENVPGIINLALDQVCTDLESLGYAVWPVCLPACAVDAPHIRQRIWILAYAARELSYGTGARSAGWAELTDNGNAPYAGRPLLQGRQPERAAQWLPEPSVGRVAYGVPARVDRLRALGNAIVPQIAEILGRMILEADR
jgi:DNA (cytosine-5)-methyltransferase 1